MHTIRARMSAAIAMVMAAVVTHYAAAQGTSEKLPDPINEPELAVYAAHLQLSDQQQRALDSLFGEYRERFAELRQGRLAQALELDDFALAEQLPALMRLIAEVDESLFAAIEPILADEQVPRLGPVRLMRERARLNSLRKFREHSCYSFVDLRAALDHVDLTSEEYDHIAPVLEAHEQQVIVAMRAFFTDSARFSAGHDEAGEDLIERGEQIRAMNIRALRQLEQLLAPRQGDELRWRFSLAGYPQARFAARLGVELQYAAALELPQTTPAMREAIVGAWQALRPKRLAIHQQALEAVDGYRITRGWDQQASLDRHEKLSALRTAAHDLNEQAKRALHSMYDAETVERLAAFPDHPNVGSEHHYGTLLNGYSFNSVRLEPTRPSNLPKQVVRPDQFVPGPITPDEVQMYTELLGGEAPVASILNDLHERYQQRFGQSVQPLIDAVLEANPSRHAVDEGDDDDEQAQREQARIHIALHDERDRLRRRAMAAVNEVDEWFARTLSELLVEHAVSPEALQRVRLNRQRNIYEYGRPFNYGAWPNKAAQVDLSQLVLDRVHRDHRPVLVETLLEYEQDYVQALQARFEALWRRQHAGDTNYKRIVLGMLDEGDHYVTHQQRVRETNRLVAETNQRYVLRLTELLPQHAADDLLDAFERAAYPSVFEDPLAIHNALTAAFELPGLSSDQRSELGEIAAVYRPQYHELTRAMIDLTADHYSDIPANLTMGETEEQQRRQTYANAIERLRFERDEVNRQASQRLRGVLDRDQLRRIGALVEPAAAARSAP